MSLNEYCSSMMLRRAGGHGTGPSNTLYIGYVPYAVSGNISHITDITKAMLDDPAAGIEELTPARLDAYRVAEVPAGSWLLIILPYNSMLAGYKDNGAGVPVAFSEDLISTGTGSNGDPINIDGTMMRVYGEICMASGNRYLYVR